LPVAAKDRMVDELLFSHIKAGHAIESINAMLPFYRRYVLGGGSIPMASTLRLRLTRILETKKGKLTELLGTLVHCLSL
jgi:hypothetical protein